jgi:hypothetical protein
LTISAGPFRKRGGDRRPFRRRNQLAAEEFVLDACDGLPRVKAKLGGEFRDRGRDAAGMLDPTGQRGALADRFVQDLAKSEITRAGNDRRKRAAERPVRISRAFQQHIEDELLEQLRFGGFIEHAEAGRDIGLERELLQEPGAESMNGLHLEAARGLERLREQPARGSAAPARGPFV